MRTPLTASPARIPTFDFATPPANAASQINEPTVSSVNSRNPPDGALPVAPVMSDVERLPSELRIHLIRSTFLRLIPQAAASQLAGLAVVCKTMRADVLRILNDPDNRAIALCSSRKATPKLGEEAYSLWNQSAEPIVEKMAQLAADRRTLYADFTSTHPVFKGSNIRMPAAAKALMTAPKMTYLHLCISGFENDELMADSDGRRLVTEMVIDSLVRDTGAIDKNLRIHFDCQQTLLCTVTRLCEALRDHTTERLVGLNLSGTAPWSYLDWQSWQSALSEYLARSKELLSLDLSKTPMTSRGFGLIAAAIAGNTSLRYLSLSENDLGRTGIAALSAVLRFNTTLRTLRLEACGLTSNRADGLLESLVANTTLKRLYIGGNPLRLKHPLNALSRVQQYFPIGGTDFSGD